MTIKTFQKMKKNLIKSTLVVAFLTVAGLGVKFMKLLINVFCGAIVFCFTLSIYSCKEKPMDFSKVDSLKLEKTFAYMYVSCYARKS